MKRMFFLFILPLFALPLVKPVYAASPPNAEAATQQKVNSLKKLAPNLKPTVIKLALNAYERIRKQGYDQQQLLTIIDYSKPSTEKRFYVFDLKRNRLLFQEWVAHGVNSGNTQWSTQFSNQPNSKESSIGAFLTSNVYYGHRGYSLNLVGLEKGINDNALRRRIVIHGADYVSASFVRQFGRLGLSWGCPALETRASKPVINKIKNGTLVFAYYPNRSWLNHSVYARV